MEKEKKFIANAKLTSKGQITIPKVVRETLDLNEGDTVVFYLDNDSNVKMSNLNNCKIKTDDDSQKVGVERKNNE